MKINYGCGRRVTEGFYNIDAQHNPKAPRPPELLHALEFTPRGGIVDITPLPDGVADEVHSYHVIEHFYAWEAPAAIREFARLLKPGGRLVLELPDLESACRNLLKGHKDQMCMWPLYGDPGQLDPYMCHKWGYTPKSIVALVQGNGFVKAKVLPPQTHGRRSNRDMRVEAVNL